MQRDCMSTGHYDVSQAASDYRKGRKTTDEIANALGVSRATLYKRLREHGVELRQVSWTPLSVADRAEILRLSADGLTIGRISELTSRSVSAINRVRRDAQFEGPRTHGRSQG